MEGELQTLRAAIEGARTRDELSGPLQAVALLATGGDGAALDLLLATVDRRDLARPAVRRLLVNREDQADVLQDVMLAVARGIDRFEGRAHVLTWIHGIASNCAIAFLRRRRDSAGMPDELPPAMTTRFSSIASTRMDVRAVIESLPELYHEAVFLRDIQQLSYAEVAERLDLKLNTTRARIARGRALVANRLSIPEVEGDW